jgi:hypothetical protein
MHRNSVVLHSKLAPAVVGDLLQQSVKPKSASPLTFLLLITAVITVVSWVSGAPWNDPSRQEIRQVHGRTFRLERRRGRPFSPSFYGSWEAEHDGTKIEGYFGLPSTVMISLRVWLFMMVTMAVLGVVLNLLDLTIETHFTVDPKIGLALSICFLLLSVVGYLLAQWLGSRRDAGSLAYLRQNLSAYVEHE